MNPPPASHPAQAETRLPRALFVVLGLLGLGFAIYGQTFDFGFIPYDDPPYVTENTHVRTGLSWANARWACNNLDTANWHPLTWLSLQLDAELYGLNAGGFHLTNVLWHLLAAVLLFGFLRAALAPDPRALGIAALVAALFVVHPTHVESVAWVTERKDVLSAAGLFASLWAYVRAAQTSVAEPRRRARLLTASLGFYALGLAAKSMLVTLPALLLLLDAWPLRRWPGLASDPARPASLARARSLGFLLLEKLPFAACALAAAALTLLAAQHGKALAGRDLIPWGERLENPLASAVIFLGRTLWPVRLQFFYLYPPATWSATAFAAAGAGLLGITAGVIWQWRVRPYLLVGWAWYLVTLAPVSGIIPVGNQPVPDRYAYLPHVGLFLIAGCAGAEWWGRSRSPRRASVLAVGGAAGTVLLAATLASWREASFWRDGVTFFEHIVSVTEPGRPPRLHALQRLGVALASDGRPDEAASCFREALEMRPNDRDTLGKIGFLSLQAGRWQEAVDFLVRAVLPDDPDAVESYNNLGVALSQLGRDEAAARAYEHALRLRPEYGPTHFNFARLLAAHGAPREAVRHFEGALAARPDWSAALAAFAILLAAPPEGAAALADPPRARALAERAVQLGARRDPEAFDALGTACAALGQWPEAADAAQMALSLTAAEDEGGKTLARRQERLERLRVRQMPAPAPVTAAPPK